MKLPTKIIENAVNEISKLPGIGKKTALRLSLYLLKKDLQFSKNISKAFESYLRTHLSNDNIKGLDKQYKSFKKELLAECKQIINESLRSGRER